MKGIEPIRTNVGAAGYAENYVRGESVRERLLGVTSRWSLLSRFLGGPSLSAEDSALLEDVLIATVAPDPRIWPLKIGWIIGAYGDWWAAGAAVQGMLAECRMGPWACAAACATVEALLAIRAHGSTWFERRVVEWANAEWKAGRVVWGFGVAGGRGRGKDERLSLIDRAMRAHGYAERPHYRAAVDGAAAITEATGREPNMALGVAAIGLDLGMDRGQIEALMFQVLEPQILGNAFESSRRVPSQLRQLPEDRVDYKGPAPRRSSRVEEPMG